MSIAKLKTELTDDPLGRGYEGMTDAEIVARGRVKDRPRNRTSMTGSEIVNAVVPSEWIALSDVQRSDFWDIVHLGTVNPFGIEATLLTNIFGAPSDTIAALQASRVELVSRNVEQGLGNPGIGNVAQARL